MRQVGLSIGARAGRGHKQGLRHSEVNCTAYQIDDKAVIGLSNFTGRHMGHRPADDLINLDQGGWHEYQHHAHPFPSFCTMF